MAETGDVDRDADRRVALAAASLTLLATVVVWFNYSAVLPRVAEAWSLSGTAAGTLFAAFQAGYVLAVVPAGRLADRRDPRHVIGAGAFGAGIATLGFALTADGFVAGVGWRLVAGVCTAGVYVPGMRFVGDWYADARGRAMGVYVGSFSVGTGLAFLLATPLATRVGWRSAVAATSLGAAVAGPALVAVTRAPPATGADADTDGGGVRALLGNRRYRHAVTAYAGHNWEMFAIRNWITALLLTTPVLALRPNGAAIAGVLAGVLMLAGGLGNLLGGWASDRLGRGRTVALAVGGSGLITVGLGLLETIRVPLAGLAVLVVVYGALLTADSAPVSTAVAEVVADERVGLALSLQSVAGFLVTVVSPVAFGAALDIGGFRLAFPVLAVGAAVGVAAALALGRASAAESTEVGEAGAVDVSDD